MSVRKETGKVQGKSPQRCETAPRIVLVGIGKGDQLARWAGWYNYPITDEDRITEDQARRITDLWLFNGTQKSDLYKAEFIGIKTRDELVREYNYPAKGKAHGEKYLLFKIHLRYPYVAEDMLGDVEKVIVRLKDFSRSPNVRKKLKAWLESSDRGGTDLVNKLPQVFNVLQPEQLYVCDGGMQMDLFGIQTAERLTIKNRNLLNIVSLFSGCGGLDLGFKNAGFNIVWANEYDKDIWETYERNHPETYLCRKSVCDVDSSEIPDCIGIIGGPPCQSWSEGGAQRGINDKRGQLFFDYIRILKDKKPLFFLAENVSGMLQDRHHEALEDLKHRFMQAGYTLSFNIVNAWEYGVPQDRERVLFVGYRNDLNKTFKMPSPIPVDERTTLRDAIGDLVTVPPGQRKNGLVEVTTPLTFPNHEYMTGGFSSIYMSRNRVRSWDEPSFTIQAGGRQSPLHPQAPKMHKVSENHFIFVHGSEDLYRRLSVRESARIQTFPDDFIWYYKNIAHGYKMIGNAVPVLLAEVVARQIRKDIIDFINRRK